MHSQKKQVVVGLEFRMNGLYPGNGCGAFLEDAMLVSCGHSFGGVMLRRVIETKWHPVVGFGSFLRKWGFEKLVYKYSKTEIRRDHKYGVQPPSIFATEVHMSENTVGKTTHKTEGRIMYYHYHGTISKRREPCRKMVNGSIVKWKDSDMWWTPQ
ncbi:hypothetical protein LguiA_000459 [Lonicera macranthoides]